MSVRSPSWFKTDLVFIPVNEATVLTHICVHLAQCSEKKHGEHIVK